MRHLPTLCLPLLLALAGCGGGSAAAGPSAPAAVPTTTVMVTNHYPGSTAIESQGPVLTDARGAATATRHGAWTFRHAPADGNGVAWTKVYVNGVWDEAVAWTEFNADGSIRDDRNDRP